MPRSTARSRRPATRNTQPFFQPEGQGAFFSPAREPEATPVIQRELERDAAGNLTGNYQFQPGPALSWGFLRQAREAVADGSLNDDEIEQLRLLALRQRGSVTQAERLLMAGLLDPANVPTLQGHRRGTFAFPMASITRANRDHVANVGRESLPPEVVARIDAALAAFNAGDALTVLNMLALAQDAAAQAILQRAGRGYQTQATAIVAFAQLHHLDMVDVLTAMQRAASDSSTGDQVLAVMTYAIAAQAGHPTAPRLRAGSIHVDALIDRAFARLTGNAQADAFYTSVALSDVTKADTLYLRTSMDITQLSHRALIIHELTHAEDDAAAPQAGQRVPQLQFEARAYEAQMAYLLEQILASPAAERPGMVAQAAQTVGIHGLFEWALIVAAKRDPARFRPLATQILTTAPNAIPPANIAAAFAMSNANLQTQLQQAIGTLPIYAAGNQVLVEGHTGETIMDHFN